MRGLELELEVEHALLLLKKKKEIIYEKGFVSWTWKGGNARGDDVE